MTAFCEYNENNNPYWCSAIWGYCQFQISSMINHHCPIYNQFPRNPIHIVEDIDDETLQKYSHMTVYDKDNKLISLGDTAFQNYKNELSLDIPYVRYIGKNAFTDCLNLKALDFSKKTDTDIPVLASLTAFMKSNSSEFVNETFKIKIPKNLYSEWSKAPNWEGLKKFLVEV